MTINETTIQVLRMSRNDIVQAEISQEIQHQYLFAFKVANVPDDFCRSCLEWAAICGRIAGDFTSLSLATVTAVLVILGAWRGQSPFAQSSVLHGDEHSTSQEPANHK
jgi:hypothetical protein